MIQHQSLVYVVLLNWNNAYHTLPCLESLARVDYPAQHIIVVDNGSTDGSPALIRERFPDVLLIEPGYNAGFCEGNNIGFRRAIELGADYLLELNNDTEVAPDFLTRLVEVCESDPRIGVVGPKIYYHSHPNLLWSVGGQVDPLGRPRQLGLNEPDRGQYDVRREVDYVSGCALLIKRPVAEKVGLNDPAFFIYFEEMEWCARVRQAGFKVVCVPQAKVWHKISPEARAASARHTYLMARNRLLFLRKCGASALDIGRVVVGEYLRTVLAWTVKPRHRQRRGNRAPLLRGILDFYAGRYGQGPYPAG